MTFTRESVFAPGDSRKCCDALNPMMADASPVAPYEDKAKNILKAELKRRGITYAQLAEKLKSLGASESERNIANKISRGSFTAAFFMMCMDAIGVRDLSLEA